MRLFQMAAILAAATVFAAQTSRAGDNTLYDAPPPDDAAFLRWIGQGAAPEMFGITSLGQAGDAFHPVSAARARGAVAGVYYTAAKDMSGQVVVIEEPARPDRSKVLLTLLNLTDGPVRLVLPEQNVDVIGATSANQAGGRAVNPVSARLAVISAKGAALGAFDVQLRRGQNLTFVARADGARLVENRFGPNLER